MTEDGPVSPELARVLKGQLCSGCGGCAALVPDKISMKVSPAGYNRPVQTGMLTSEEESTFAEICPGTGLIQRAEGREDHPLWGPLIAVRTGHASDPDLRHHASSGGVLSAVLIHLIETGAVEFVLQIFAEMDPACRQANPDPEARRFRGKRDPQPHSSRGLYGRRIALCALIASGWARGSSGSRPAFRICRQTL